MNNSLSNGSSVLSTLLTAKKAQPFVAKSVSPVVEKRESAVIDRASGSVSARDIAQSPAGRQSASFRAAMSEVASAKAEARREAADKQWEQQAAARKAREQSRERRNSIATDNESPGQTLAKPKGYALNQPKEKVEASNSGPPGEIASSTVNEATGHNELVAGNALDGSLADAVDQAGVEDMNIDDLLDAEEGPQTPFSVLAPSAEAEIVVQGVIPDKALNPEGISLPSLTAEPGPADAVQTGLQAPAVPSATIPAIAAQATTGRNEINKALTAKVDGKSASPTGEPIADAFVGEGTVEQKDLSSEDNKALFGRLLAVAQGNRDGQTTNQELTTVKASLAALQIPESATRPAESPTPAMRGFVVQSGVPLTMGQPRWGEAVGERVLWLAAQNLSSAELRLDPPELGPMQVRISIQHDQAAVSFSSPHPGVREALDQSAVRLREMFHEQGLNLLNLDVSDQPLARQQTGEHGSGHRAGQGAETESTEEETTTIGTSAKLNTMRLIDHYA